MSLVRFKMKSLKDKFFGDEPETKKTAAKPAKKKVEKPKKVTNKKKKRK